MFPQPILDAAEQVLAAARAKRLKLATAESCTGGLIIASLTEIAGSSDVVDRGFITYSNEAKMALVDVSLETLETAGAVSPKTVEEMVIGALDNSDADIAVSVSGIAGPGGGTYEKPVGLVWFGIGSKDEPPSAEEQRFGDIGRSEIRMQTVQRALSLLADEIKKHPDAPDS